LVLGVPGCYGARQDVNPSKLESTPDSYRPDIYPPEVAMTWLNTTNEQCEALFASALQRSDILTAELVTDAINGSLRALGSGGCACRMAEEFGDHPEAAMERMQWARQVLGELSATPFAATPLAASRVDSAA
jgi:hypothetical protein